MHLIEENSLLCHFVAEMRDIEIQKDAMRFRRNVERVGEIMAYELSKKLHYTERDVQTPLGVARCAQISDQIVIGTILRAGRQALGNGEKPKTLSQKQAFSAVGQARLMMIYQKIFS